MAKKTVKLVLIFIFVLPALFFLNTGFSSDPLWKTFQTIGFLTAFSTSLVWPVLKKYLLILSGVLLIIMSIAFIGEAKNLFIFGELSWAEIFGSSSFGLALLLLISYVPQLIKKGYIENI